VDEHRGSERHIVAVRGFPAPLKPRRSTVQVDVYSMAGEVVDTLEISDGVFGVTPNLPLMHQAVVRQLANRRVGTAATKTRGMVRGGGAKPFKQKGTGRARQGSRRAPHFKGGGVVFGPQPRDYHQDMPRKMRRQAIRSALSVKVADQQLVVLDRLEVAAPRTKDIVALLEALPVQRKVLVLLAGNDNGNVILSARNIPGVKTMPASSVNVLDVLNHDFLLAPVSAVREVEATFDRP
jgi:large subunit ribosomal protein L4